MIDHLGKSPKEFNQMDKDDLIGFLMDEYGQNIIRLAYTYVKQKQLAEDVTQDVFIKCYEKLDGFRGESSYKTWLYRIAVNHCKDIVKSWSYKNVIFTEFISTKKRRMDESAENTAVLKEENNELAQKVMSLPIRLREAIILHYYEQLKIEEIAELLKCNQNTVKSRLLRARKSLRKMLEGGDR